MESRLTSLVVFFGPASSPWEAAFSQPFLALLFPFPSLPPFQVCNPNPPSRRAAQTCRLDPLPRHRSRLLDRLLPLLLVRISLPPPPPLPPQPRVLRQPLLLFSPSPLLLPSVSI